MQPVSCAIAIAFFVVSARRRRPEGDRLLEEAVWESRKWSRGVEDFKRDTIKGRKNLDEWGQFVLKVYRTIRKTFLKNLTVSMPKRIRKCIELDGAKVKKWND